MATVALAGGGTGGHVYPAIAIGDVLRERGHEVLYYGDEGRLEGRVAPRHGYTFRSVRAVAYPRSGVLGKIRFAWGLLRSTLATVGLLRRDRVDLVLGVGGYISAPPVLGAWLLRRRSAVHEANAVPGLAKKVCARVSNLVLITYETTRARLSGRAPVHLVGMPVNPKVLQGDKAKARERYGLTESSPVILFVGGSLGAARINELALAVAQQPDRNCQVLHLCGQRYLEEVEAALGDPPSGVRLVGYEDQMGFAYALADLVVCRAGSSTLAELTAVGRASLLIPSPNVAENHQEANARDLERAGAAEVLVERDFDLPSAVARIETKLADVEQLSAMGEAARGLARLDAAERAADLVEALLR